MHTDDAVDKALPPRSHEREPAPPPPESIQEQRQHLPKRPLQPRPEAMAAHKNAFVQDMLAKIRPFVDSRGLIKLTGDSDSLPDGLLELLKSENDMVPRVLLATLLMHPGHGQNGGWTAMAKSKELLEVFDGWFKEAVSEYIKTLKAVDCDAQGHGNGNGPLLLVKLVDLLTLLPVELETLLGFKFGRSLKRLIGALAKSELHDQSSADSSKLQALDSQVKIKARSLFSRWSSLAEHHEETEEGGGIVNDDKVANNSSNGNGFSKRIGSGNGGGVSSAQSLHSSSVTAPAAAESTAVEAVPVGKASMPSAIFVSSSSSSSTINARPISSDDIQKEKKRKAYLESIGIVLPCSQNSYGHLEVDKTNEAQKTNEDTSGVTEIPGVSRADREPDAAVTSELEIKRIKKDKRVSFPDDPKKLIQVRLFVQDPEESANDEDSSNLAALAINEASYAFDRLRDVMEEAVDWKRPELLEPTGGYPNSQTDFWRREKAREHTALSTYYHSVEMVPMTPNEQLEDAAISNPKIVDIPMRDPQNSTPVVKHLKTVHTAQTLHAAKTPPIVSPELLSALLLNISSLPGKPSAGGPEPLPPNINNMYVNTANDKPEKDIPPPPPPRTQYHRPGVGQSTLPNRVKSKRDRPQCKFYREGVPGSCRSGSACPFQHGH